MNTAKQDLDSYLKRLPRANYRGTAYIHWSLAIQDRRTGWLKPNFYYKFRELLAHTMFRYGVTCPIFCCMPDHIHLMWIGLFDGTDQLNAMRYFRKQVNSVLNKVGFELQGQSYDNILREDERERGAFEDVCEYIARNPERQRLVLVDEFRQYAYTNCLIPGAPEVSFADAQFWETFWRIYSAVLGNGLMKQYP